jgi:hypothetical protein
MIRRSKMKLPEAFSLLEAARAGAPVRCRRTKGRALLADDYFGTRSLLTQMSALPQKGQGSSAACAGRWFVKSVAARPEEAGRVVWLMAGPPGGFARYSQVSTLTSPNGLRSSVAFRAVLDTIQQL